MKEPAIINHANNGYNEGHDKLLLNIFKHWGVRINTVLP